MALSIRNINHHFLPPQSGRALISEPYLGDYHFRRTVILISDHGAEGSVGFILNRLVDLKTSDVIPGLLDHDFPLYYGGPVEPNTLHFIHRLGDAIPGAQLIANNIYWGGDIEAINQLLENNLAQPEDFKFFSGYSGWEPGQLEDEISQKAWWTGHITQQDVFGQDIEMLWPKIVKQLGGDFSYMADAPEDRSWN